MRLDRPLLMALLLAPLSFVWAQDKDAPENRFQVDVLVFSRDIPPGAAYRFDGEPETGDAIRLDEVGEPTEAFLASPQIVMDLPYEPVEATVLAGTATRLQQLQRYRVEALLAWRQDAEVFGDAQRVRVRSDVPLFAPEATPVSFGAPVTQRVDVEPLWRVDGTMSFERGRFPHLRLDIVLRTPVGKDLGMGERAPAVRSDGRAYQAYRINLRQQIELGQPRYFDHPQFGVIAVVTEIASDQTR